MGGVIMNATDRPAGLTDTEARVFWRTLDAPHAQETEPAEYEYPSQPAMPRMGSRTTVCCGVVWEDAWSCAAHIADVHDSRF